MRSSLLLLLMFSIAAPAAAGNYYEPHFGSRMMTIATETWGVGPGSVVLLGDSNTEMVRPIVIGDCQVINAGFGGARIADIAKRADGLATLTKPTIVHVMVGTNDARADLKNAQSPDPAVVTEFREEWANMAMNLGNIVDAFRSHGAIVILWRLPPTGPSAGDLGNYGYVNELISKVAREKGVELETDWVAPMTGPDGYAKPGWLVGDDIHLTPNGQKARVARIAALDSSILEQHDTACLK